MVSALQEMGDGGAADILVGFIHLDQQGDVGGRVFAGKGHGRTSVALGQGNCSQAIALPARDQTGHLRPAVATGMLQIPEQYPALTLAALWVVKPLEHPADVPIPLVVVSDRREVNRRTGPEKLFDLAAFFALASLGINVVSSCCRIKSR